ncbi:hypothetical protein W04_3180 [Pseudoalteromonas sp. SW0106-04]|nr:hypothetical protein W04_3180 [Pseudoalteromonas sp. SW0106-04]
MALEILGAMQQAPHPKRQSIYRSPLHDTNSQYTIARFEP